MTLKVLVLLERRMSRLGGCEQEMNLQPARLVQVKVRMEKKLDRQTLAGQGQSLTSLVLTQW